MTEQQTQVIDGEVDRPDIGDLDNGTAIAPVEVPTRKIVVPIGRPIGDLDQLYRLAQALAQGTQLPTALRGKPADILITLMWGAELGLSGLQAINGIYVTNGRPNLTGILWNALVLAAGHGVDSVEDIDDRGLPTCETTLTRGDTGRSVTVKWTIANAERAGLCKVVDGQIRARSKNGDPLPWEQYPEDMLFWRTLVRCCRRLAPEVAFGFGLHDPSPMVDEHGVEVVEAVRVPPLIPQPQVPVDAGAVADEVRATVAEFAPRPVVDVSLPDAAEQPVVESVEEPDPTLGLPDDYVDPWTAATEPRMGDPECVLVHNNDGTVLHEGPCVTAIDDPADETRAEDALPLDEPEVPPTKRARK